MTENREVTAQWLVDHQSEWRSINKYEREDLPGAWIMSPFGNRFLVAEASLSYIGRWYIYIVIVEWPSLREQIKTVKPDCPVTLSFTLTHTDLVDTKGGSE